MNLSTMDDWLAWIGKLHTTQIDLGLERVRRVAERLDLLKQNCPIVIIGGTNGKGSTVAALEALYRTMGYHVGSFTSPFLFAYNEQVRIDGSSVADAVLCKAFEQVKNALHDTTLTPFEFGTLAAMVVFQQQHLDVWLLEVGLGGRLDAVNILDADVAVITSISLDHIEWLGDTREKIGFEKAGIFRPNRPAVCGDWHTPLTVLETAAAFGTTLYCQGRDFGYEVGKDDWTWWFGTSRQSGLPLGHLATQNMATMLMTAQLLESKLPITRASIIKALQEVTVPGRVQVIPGPIAEIYDVSHNPASVELLAEQLSRIPCDGKTYAVFSMLADKDMLTSLEKIYERIDGWYIAPLKTKRAASLDKMIENFAKLQITNIHVSSTVRESLEQARQQAKVGDRIIIFGSFHTIAEANEKGSKDS